MVTVVLPAKQGLTSGEAADAQKEDRKPMTDNGVDKMIKEIADKYGNWMYFVFRIFVGLLFFQHGAQKLFGWFGGQAVEPFSLMGLAGVVEAAGGVLIAIGLLTRWAAAVSAIQMLAAYYMMHFPKAWTPIANKGELALLYFAAFLVLIKEGAGRWSVDNKGAD